MVTPRDTAGHRRSQPRRDPTVRPPPSPGGGTRRIRDALQFSVCNHQSSITKTSVNPAHLSEAPGHARSSLRYVGGLLTIAQRGLHESRAALSGGRNPQPTGDGRSVHRARGSHGHPETGMRVEPCSTRMRTRIGPSSYPFPETASRGVRDHGRLASRYNQVRVPRRQVVNSPRKPVLPETPVPSRSMRRPPIYGMGKSPCQAPLIAPKLLRLFTYDTEWRDSNSRPRSRTHG